MRWRRIVVALFFGLASAVFADAYWLSEIFAPQSRRLIAGVVLIGALATAIAFSFTLGQKNGGRLWGLNVANYWEEAFFLELSSYLVAPLNGLRDHFM